MFFKTNRNIFFTIILGIILIIFEGCQTDTVKENQEKPIATLKEYQLYFEDIRSALPSGLSKKDSLEMIHKLIDKWASDILLYDEAISALNDEDKNVDKEVEKYRQELLSYRFQNQLLDQQLDTNVSFSEIEQYYNDNPQSFLLKNNIVKAIYVKAPKNIPNIDKFKKVCVSDNPKDSTLLKSMCIQFADNYFIDKNIWLLFEDLKKEIPQLMEVPEYNLLNGKVLEFSDSLSIYILKIKEIKIKNSLSPLNFEKNNIKSLLINQRKQYLIKKYKKDLLEKAKSDKLLIN